MAKSNSTVANIISIVLAGVVTLGLAGFIKANADDIQQNARRVGDIEGDIKLIRYIIESEYPERAKEYKINKNEVDIALITS